MYRGLVPLDVPESQVEELSNEELLRYGRWRFAGWQVCCLKSRRPKVFKNETVFGYVVVRTPAFVDFLYRLRKLPGDEKLRAHCGQCYSSGGVVRVSGGLFAKHALTRLLLEHWESCDRHRPGKSGTSAIWRAACSHHFHDFLGAEVNERAREEGQEAAESVGPRTQAAV